MPMGTLFPVFSSVCLPFTAGAEVAASLPRTAHRGLIHEMVETLGPGNSFHARKGFLAVRERLLDLAT